MVQKDVTSHRRSRAMDQQFSTGSRSNQGRRMQLFDVYGDILFCGHNRHRSPPPSEQNAVVKADVYRFIHKIIHMYIVHTYYTYIRGHIIYRHADRRVVGIWRLVPCNPVRLTSPFARRRSINWTLNVLVALRDCRAIPFDSCNSLLLLVPITRILAIVRRYCGAWCTSNNFVS